MQSAGVSVVVCCHNSASRLPTTLAHLASQRLPAGVACEVLVVDNASTDDTTSIAQRLWPGDAAWPLRVVHEPALGLSNARDRGFIEARYEFVSFVDDDNWVCPDWVGVVHEILSQHPCVAACGGKTEAAFESPPPDWFARYQGNFAVGCQHEGPGDVTDQPSPLWGAGLCVRKSAWLGLRESGFQFHLTGRKGLGLTAGEDHELCYGLILMGWRVWYDPRLCLRHYMPKGRIDWRYARRLLRGAGWTGAWLDPYREMLGQLPQQNWLVEVVRLTFLLARNPARLLACCCLLGNGRPVVASHEYLVGRLGALLFHRRSIADLREQLRRSISAPRRPFPPDASGIGECNLQCRESAGSRHQGAESLQPVPIENA